MNTTYLISDGLATGFTKLNTGRVVKLRVMYIIGRHSYEQFVTCVRGKAGWVFVDVDGAHTRTLLVTPDGIYTRIGLSRDKFDNMRRFLLDFQRLDNLCSEFIGLGKIKPTQGARKRRLAARIERLHKQEPVHPMASAIVTELSKREYAEEGLKASRRSDPDTGGSACHISLAIKRPSILRTEYFPKRVRNQAETLSWD